MTAIIEGRLDRRAAHLMVAPWVEDDDPVHEDGTLSGATIIHGLDLVRGHREGTVRHADYELEHADFILTEAEAATRCRDWLHRWVDAQA